MRVETVNRLIRDHYELLEAAVRSYVRSHLKEFETDMSNAYVDLLRSETALDLRKRLLVLDQLPDTADDVAELISYRLRLCVQEGRRQADRGPESRRLARPDRFIKSPGKRIHAEVVPDRAMREAIIDVWYWCGGLGDQSRGPDWSGIARRRSVELETIFSSLDALATADPVWFDENFPELGPHRNADRVAFED